MDIIKELPQSTDPDKLTRVYSTKGKIMCRLSEDQQRIVSSHNIACNSYIKTGSKELLNSFNSSNNIIVDTSENYYQLETNTNKIRAMFYNQ